MLTHWSRLSIDASGLTIPSWATIPVDGGMWRPNIASLAATPPTVTPTVGACWPCSLHALALTCTFPQLSRPLRLHPSLLPTPTRFTVRPTTVARASLPVCPWRPLPDPYPDRRTLNYRRRSRRSTHYRPICCTFHFLHPTEQTPRGNRGAFAVFSPVKQKSANRCLFSSSLTTCPNEASPLALS